MLLSDIIKKALVNRQGCWSGEQLIEQPWLQLMCYALVSSHEVGHVFWSDGSHQDRGSKEANEGVRVDKTRGVRVDKTRLGPDDVNLQTKEIHCSYSVLIVSAE